MSQAEATSNTVNAICFAVAFIVVCVTITVATYRHYRKTQAEEHTLAMEKERTKQLEIQAKLVSEGGALPPSGLSESLRRSTRKS